MPELLAPAEVEDLDLDARGPKKLGLALDELLRVRLPRLGVAAGDHEDADRRRHAGTGSVGDRDHDPAGGRGVARRIPRGGGRPRNRDFHRPVPKAPASRIDQLLIMTVMAAEVVAFPVASRAVAVSVWAPLALPRESHGSVYLVGVRSVVVAAPKSCPSSWKRTSASSRSSTAVAVSLTAPASVAFAAGVNSDTTGDPTSASAGGWFVFHCATAWFQ